MKRFIKGLSYTFHPNLGRKDRLIRAVIAMMVLIAYTFDWLTGMVGIIISVLALMILATSLVARCGVTYWFNANTMTLEEKKSLELKGVDYE